MSHRVTDVSLLTFELAPKRFELFDLIPSRAVALLANPHNSSWLHSKRVIDDVEQAARSRGLLCIS